MEENKAIRLEDLQIGDEVIVTGIRYLKILKKPTIRLKPTRLYGSTGYKSIKCLDMHFSKFKKGEDREVYYDFNYCDIWLVKRATI
jgi:hypothetical protein